MYPKLENITFCLLKGVLCFSRSRNMTTNAAGAVIPAAETGSAAPAEKERCPLRCVGGAAVLGGTLCWRAGAKRHKAVSP